jgi:hypothetical protein
MRLAGWTCGVALERERKRMKRVLVVVGVWIVGDSVVVGQVTNSPSAVASTITSSVGSAYDIGIGIVVSVIAIGAVLAFVKRGLGKAVYPYTWWG